MAKIVKYTLTTEGKIPEYVLDGGYFLSSNENKSPQDNNLLGIAETTFDPLPENCLEVFESEDDLRTYLTGAFPEEDAAEITNKVDILTNLLSNYNQ